MIHDLDVCRNRPVLRPVPIPTKGKPWYKRLYIWLTATRKWEIAEDYLLYIPWLETMLLLPKGFIFDGASIPRPLWPLLAPTGVLFIPAMFHDFGYKYGCYVNSNRASVYDSYVSDNIVHTKGQTKWFFDNQFRLMSIAINGMSVVNAAAWAAVYIFGALAWYGKRKSRKDPEALQQLLYPDKVEGAI